MVRLAEMTSHDYKPNKDMTARKWFGCPNGKRCITHSVKDPIVRKTNNLWTINKKEQNKRKTNSGSLLGKRRQERELQREKAKERQKIIEKEVLSCCRLKPRNRSSMRSGKEGKVRLERFQVKPIQIMDEQVLSLNVFHIM